MTQRRTNKKKADPALVASKPDSTLVDSKVAAEIAKIVKDGTHWVDPDRPEGEYDLDPDNRDRWILVEDYSYTKDGLTSYGSYEHLVDSITNPPAPREPEVFDPEDYTYVKMVHRLSLDDRIVGYVGEFGGFFPAKDLTLDEIIEVRSYLADDYPLCVHGWDGVECHDLSCLARLVEPEPTERQKKEKKFLDRFAGSLIDWQQVADTENDVIDWLCEPLIECGRQVAVFSEAKAGKSLLMAEIVAALVTGRPALDNAAREPARVLYIDLENNRRDLWKRFKRMGYTPADLKPRLFYYSFPDLSFLDTEKGGKELFALAVLHNVDLVVIDTLSRVTEGGENDNDTYKDFYNHTGKLFKARETTLLRLDHSGKDPAKGQRGASSKTSDVDDVWQLVENGDELTLKRTHSRMANGSDYLKLTRLGGSQGPQAGERLRHEVRGVDDDTGSDEVSLDLLGVPLHSSQQAAWTWYKDNVPADERVLTAAKVMAAQKLRKSRS